MPLKARIDVAGALHHIIVRGIERRKIFYDDADRDAFVNLLGWVLIETQTGGIRIRLKLVACYGNSLVHMKELSCWQGSG